jgi:uncharacterized protein (TIGR00369 family)
MDVHTTTEAFNAHVQRESRLGVWFGLTLEAVGSGTARLRLPYRDEFLRPGGVVHGPVIMAAADYAMYAAVMGLDPRGEAAVTTNLNMYFLRKTAGKDLIAEAQVLRAGRRLAVLEVLVHADGEEEPVAQVSGTYAFPD